MCPQQGAHSGHLCQGSSVGLKQVSKSSNHIGASVNRPLLSSPRCWTHHQSQERRGGPVPGPGTGCDRSPDRAVHALFSHASWSLRCGVSVLQVLQALQAAEHTTRPAGAEPSFFVLTTDGTTSSSSAKQAQFLCTPLPPTKLPRISHSAHTRVLHKGLLRGQMHLQGFQSLIKTGMSASCPRIRNSFGH